MGVLRQSKDDVLTILEVLTHDPLYNWSMTPEKAYRIQYGREPDAAAKAKWNKSTSEQKEKEGNRMAERALLRVRVILISWNMHVF
jgi:phosphatidylinositol kinase/protein kinase (PI-3  family)